jgi:hypothetical protein
MIQSLLKKSAGVVRFMDNIANLILYSRKSSTPIVSHSSKPPPYTPFNYCKRIFTATLANPSNPLSKMYQSTDKKEN